MKITLTNDYHNTEITLASKGDYLSAGQVVKARRTLCGVSGCTCGDDLGRRGQQDNEIEPLIDNQTGKINGARIYL